MNAMLQTLYRVDVRRSGMNEHGLAATRTHSRTSIGSRKYLAGGRRLRSEFEVDSRRAAGQRSESGALHGAAPSRSSARATAAGLAWALLARPNGIACSRKPGDGAPRATRPRRYGVGIEAQPGGAHNRDGGSPADRPHRRLARSTSPGTHGPDHGDDAG